MGIEMANTDVGGTDMGEPRETGRLEPGDVAVLRSGGPRMTVISRDDENATVACVWWSAMKGDYEVTSFDAPALMRDLRTPAA